MSAPAITTTITIAGHATSRYVKRCDRCRVVRGNSQFNGRPGYRADVCRFCDEHDKTREKKLRGDMRKLTQLHVTERRMARELEKLRLRIRTLEHETLAVEQNNLFVAP